MTTCAIYARKSTDDSDRNEEARSTTRQIARAIEYAQARGWTVHPDAIFVDENVSGATYAKLEGRKRLIAAAEGGAFSILVMSEQSRAGRDMIECAYTLKRIAESGVTMYGYLDDAEISVEGEQALLTILRGYKDQGQQRDTSKRVYDAAIRRVKAGQVAGAKIFAYDNVAVLGPDGKRSHVERRINATQAAIVRRVFALYAGGAGSTRIARQLNAEGVLSPRPRGWSQTTVRGVLRNPIYRGEVLWGRIKSVVRRGKDHNARRPESEWLRREQPELRIIEEPLWQAVQARRERNRRIIPRTKGGRLLGRPTWHDGYSDVLVTGFGRCAACGSGRIRLTHRRYGSAKRRHSVRLYICSAFDNLGAAKCSNTVVLAHEVLDRAVREAIATVLHPAVVEAAVDRAFAQLQAEQATAVGRRAQLEREHQATERRIGRLIDALADGTLPGAAIRERLQAETARQAALAAELARAEALPDPAGLKQALEAKAADLQALLAGDVQQGRAVLRALLAGPLECEGFREPGRHGYRFKGALTIGRLLAGEAVSLTGTTPVDTCAADRARGRCGCGCRASGEAWPRSAGA
jgi:DNA invertase Pin-like site-specific DNA recombinase